jgi:hypothetical protein
MKTLHSLLVTTAFIGGLTTVAVAGDTHTPGTPGAAGTPTTSSRPAMGQPAMGSSMAGKEFKADHMMNGTISEIDQSDGSLTLKTSDGKSLTLNFPSDALKDYKEGDQVSIAIAKRSGMTESVR